MIMAFAIKAAIQDPRAKTFAFAAQKTMYGGKYIAEGDTLFVFASENEGEHGLIARAGVTSAEAIAKKGSITRQTPRVSIAARRTAFPKRSLGRRELKRFTAGTMAGQRPSSISSSIVRQRTRLSAFRVKRRHSCADSSNLDRPDEGVPLLAERELDDAFRREIGEGQFPPFIRHGHIVDLDAAALDLTPRLAGRGDEAGMGTCGEHAPALFQLDAGDLDRRQRYGDLALLEGRSRRLGGAVGGVASVHERGRFGRENLLRLVELGAAKRGELCDLFEGKFGEELEEALDICVFAVPPKLPIVVRGDHIGAEPHGAGSGLPHLGAR